MTTLRASHFGIQMTFNELSQSVCTIYTDGVGE